jgi:hypothetical protein
MHTTQGSVISTMTAACGSGREHHEGHSGSSSADHRSKKILRQLPIDSTFGIEEPRGRRVINALGTNVSREFDCRRLFEAGEVSGAIEARTGVL